MADQVRHQGGGAKNRNRRIVSAIVIAGATAKETECVSPGVEKVSCRRKLSKDGDLIEVKPL